MFFERTINYQRLRLISLDRIIINHYCLVSFPLASPTRVAAPGAGKLTPSFDRPFDARTLLMLIHRKVTLGSLSVITFAYRNGATEWLTVDSTETGPSDRSHIPPPFTNGIEPGQTGKHLCANTSYDACSSLDQNDNSSFPAQLSRTNSSRRAVSFHSK